MKISKLLVAAAAAGLLGMSARASLPDGYCSAKIKLTIMVQDSAVTSSSSVKYVVSKMKATTKDLLAEIGDEFDTSIPDGAQLVIDNFWWGDFAVLNKDGSVLLDYVSENEDSWQLWTEVDNYVYTGKSTDSSTSYNYSAIGGLYWHAGSGSDYFWIWGETSIKDSYKDSGTKETYKTNGADNGQFDGYNAVVSGSMSGSGKNVFPL